MAHPSLPVARCTGHCCRSFTLPWGPDELAEHAAKSAAYDAVTAGRSVDFTYDALALCAERSDLQWDAWQKLKARWPDNFFADFRRLMDIEQIADMVIYKGYHTREHTERSPDPEQNRKYTEEMKHDYTCKNLQPSGDCGIYSTRPRMCQDYPYGSACNYIGCTSVAAVKNNPHLEDCTAAENTPTLNTLG